MLIPAIAREQELRIRFLERIQQPDMRYFLFQSYCDYELTVDRNDWKRIQFVSVSQTGALLAYFEARLNRESLVVEDLLVMSLQSGGLALSACADGFRFVAYLLADRGFRKIFFRYVRDNPASSQYQRFLNQVGQCGSVQGVLTDYLTLADARTYDLVIMDIQKEAYLKWFAGRHAFHRAA